MPRKKLLQGPIGNGWVEELWTEEGIKYIARWQYYVGDTAVPEGRRRESGYYELGLKVYHGPKGALTSKSAAEAKWAEIRDSVMGRTEVLPAALKAEKTFRWWAEEDPGGFKKRREQRWTCGTPEWFNYISGRLYAEFGEKKLKDIREQDLQAYINKVANDGYSESVVKNSILYLRAILEEAFQCRIIPVNPSARLLKPRNTRKPNRRWVYTEQYQSVSDAAPTNRLMMKILYIGGLQHPEHPVGWRISYHRHHSRAPRRECLRFGRDSRRREPWGVPGLEDASQAHLAEWQGRKVGIFGLAGYFRFQASKNLNSGDGGAILTSDVALHERCSAFHKDGSGLHPGNFTYSATGCNLRMTEFQAAMLMAQMNRIEEQARTGTNVLCLTSMLHGIPGIAPACMYDSCTSNAYRLYIFRYDSRRFAELSRTAFLKVLAAEGVPASGGYTPLNTQRFLGCSPQSM